MRIFHIATVADWDAARGSGAYTTSTRGRTLAEEGFIHASRPEQVPGVFESFYQDSPEQLVLLTIETNLLTATWREDPVGDDRFPHIYGPLNPSAVVAVAPLERRDGPATFTGLFVGGMVSRMLLALGVMALVVAGAALWGRLAPDWGPSLGALAGLAVGVAILVIRRR